jgi:hypothetical protein
MEDSIFGPKLTKHLNLVDTDLDVVDKNYDNGENIEISDVENVKLHRRNNSNKLYRNDLILLLNYIASKLLAGFFLNPLHDGNDKAIDMLSRLFRVWKLAMAKHRLILFLQ